MTLVIGNSCIELGRGTLYLSVLGREAHIQTGSGQPFWFFAQERSSVGTQSWAFGLTTCDSRTLIA
jgi:hypothetical protein